MNKKKDEPQPEKPANQENQVFPEYIALGICGLLIYLVFRYQWNKAWIIGIILAGMGTLIFLDVVVREWIEAFVVALILAMIIRCFALEPFTIPTGSMEPTLMGDERNGDKIFVNKMVYDFTEPKRWDVMVFKYPNNPATNYIKRLVGMPGEKLEIIHGDIFINDEIAQKPKRVQEDLWMPVFQLKDGQIETANPNDALHTQDARELKQEVDRYWSLSGPWQVGMDGLSSAVGEDCRAAYRHSIKNTYITLERQRYGRGLQTAWHGSGDAMVGDFMLSTTFVLQEGNGHFQVELVREDQWFVLKVEPGEDGWVHLSRNGVYTDAAQPCPLARNVPHTLQYRVLDGRVAVYIDGLERASMDIPNHRRPAHFTYNNVRLSTSALGVNFSEINLKRDIYYTMRFDYQAWPDGQPITIDKDAYFVLGDNSTNSNDSRKWGMVPKDNLMGEAFMVFWPAKQWKLIR